MSEYALAFGLISIVGIGALVALGGNLNDLFSGMITSGRPVANTPVFPGSPSVPTPVTGTPSPALSVPIADLQIRLNDGRTIPLPNFPVNAGELIENAGVDGATRRYAQTLTDLAQSLEQAGFTTDDTRSLRRLADLGFNKATQQKGILNQYQEKLRGNMEPESLSRAYTIYQFGFWEQGGEPPSVEEFQKFVVDPQTVIQSINVGESFGEFKSTYSEILSSRLGQQPGLRAVIEKAYHEIIRAEFAVLKQIMVQQPLITNQLDREQLAAQDFNKTVSQSVKQTQTSSNDLCTTGQGDGSSLVKCEPRA